MTKKANPKYVFYKHIVVGANDAIDDTKFLNECFVDKGELDVIRDTNDPRCIVLGRTGSGKTAILETLSEEERHIKIEPDHLSLEFVSNNEVLKFFTEAGVNMDLFYRLLWRHVFIVELLRKHYNIQSDKQKDNLFQRLSSIIVNNKSKKEAINYVEQWGDQFWKETDSRIREVTNKLQTDLTKGIDLTFAGSIPGINATQANIKLANVRTMSAEQREEIRHHGQQVVDSIQITKLTEVLKMLEHDILTDKNKKYYITIDKLDEQWVNDDIRYRLIRALIEAIKDINHRLSHAKIIIAIRADLLGRVFRHTRDAGHQEEKYSSMYLTLKWNYDELENVLNKRINFLMKNQYTNETVSINNILPKRKENHQTALKYILERTLMRPRDAISFVNECIVAAVGNTTISQSQIQEAERVYSKNRLRALADEWFSDYPSLEHMLTCLLQNGKHKFTFDTFSSEEFMLKFLETFRSKQGKRIDKNEQECIIIKSFLKVEETLSLSEYKEFLTDCLRILAKVGVVGVKPNSNSDIMWGYDTDLDNDINESCAYYVHLAFHKCLNIQTPI